jgi:GT2 family glycosyltransferase
MFNKLNQVGIVMIGRNEGERLIRCFDSLSKGCPVVYVDSGSTDRSIEEAKARRIQIVNLDQDSAFTAARARNAGAKALMKLHPQIRVIQFVDGDCQLDNGWMAVALEKINTDSKIAIVTGRSREQNPGKSVFNLLCDMEWNTPVGEARYCGGNFMMRVEAFRAVKGFRDDLIAGEEPELCIRLRKMGFRIFRIDHDMTYHDANMTSFSQWWKRAVRGGHGYAEVYSLHGEYGKREVLSAFWWGLLAPLSVSVGLIFYPFLALTLFALYGILSLRIYLSRKGRGDNSVNSLIYTWFCLLMKPALVIGILKYERGRLFGLKSKIIEYK